MVLPNTFNISILPLKLALENSVRILLSLNLKLFICASDIKAVTAKAAFSA